MSELEQIIQKQNGKNWRNANVINFSFDQKKIDQILKNKKYLIDLAQQIVAPSQIVFYSNYDITNLFRALNNDNLSMTKTITKIFINLNQDQNKNELHHLVRQFIQSCVNLKELSIQIFELDYIKGAEKLLNNLKIVNFQAVDHSSMEGLGKALLQIPSIKVVSVGFHEKAYTVANNFFEQIYQHKNIEELSISFTQVCLTKIKADQSKEHAIKSAIYLSQMERLKVLRLQFMNYFGYLPEFFMSLSQNLKIDFLYINLVEVSQQLLKKCISQLGLSQVRSLYLKIYFQNYEAKLKQDTFDQLNRCPNLANLTIELHYSKENSQIQKLKSRLSKKCIRLVHSYIH